MHAIDRYILFKLNELYDYDILISYSMDIYCLGVIHTSVFARVVVLCVSPHTRYMHRRRQLLQFISVNIYTGAPALGG